MKRRKKQKKKIRSQLVGREDDLTRTQSQFETGEAAQEISKVAPEIEEVDPETGVTGQEIENFESLHNEEKLVAPENLRHNVVIVQSPGVRISVHQFDAIARFQGTEIENHHRDVMCPKGLQFAKNSQRQEAETSARHRKNKAQSREVAIRKFVRLQKKTSRVCLNCSRSFLTWQTTNQPRVQNQGIPIFSSSKIKFSFHYFF